MRRFGVAVLDQPLRRGSEIVEHVLLVRLHAALVPLLAELAAAAQVGQRENTAVLGEDDGVGTECRSFVNQKTAVAIEQRGPVAVQLKALFVDQKHGYARLVL